MKSESQIKADYFQWLCAITKIDSSAKSYWILAKELHKKEFYWTVPNDDNRGQDGKDLRDKFAENNGYNDDEISCLDGPCTMLEMLIALSRRIEDTMADPDKGDQTVKWFWMLLKNVGLDKYTDEDYADLCGTIMVNQILDEILDRTYKRSGKGGLFPLKKPEKDQRKVEIWYQMCAYLLENYYVDGEIM